jgi:hypothetical protein
MNQLSVHLGPYETVTKISVSFFLALHKKLYARDVLAESVGPEKSLPIMPTSAQRLSQTR